MSAQETFIRERVLVTVKTYPLPSPSHQELVCTAGVTAAGEWVRMYPIDFRYQPHDRQFKKYQWVEVELGQRGAGNDERKESRRPKLDSLTLVGDPLPPGDWKERRAIIDKLPHRTRDELRADFDRDKTSLGIVRPTKVHDVKIEDADGEWKPEWQQLFDQVKLFGPQQKPLRKLPYKFSYVFECSDTPSNTAHSAMIEDWELGVLFLDAAAKHGDERAAEIVRDKYLGMMCDPKRDTRFFMGTTFPWNSWVVLGVFYPPKLPPVIADQVPMF